MASERGILVIRVFTKPDCTQCNFTKKWLNENGVAYEAIDVMEDETGLSFVKALGYQGLPVVYVDKLNHWQGFRPDNLERLLDNA